MLATLVAANHGLAQWLFLIAVFVAAVMLIVGIFFAPRNRASAGAIGIVAVLFLLAFGLLLGG